MSARSAAQATARQHRKEEALLQEQERQQREAAAQEREYRESLRAAGRAALNQADLLLRDLEESLGDDSKGSMFVATSPLESSSSSEPSPKNVESPS